MLENGLDEAARIVPVDTPPQSNSPDQLEEGKFRFLIIQIQNNYIIITVRNNLQGAA